MKYQKLLVSAAMGVLVGSSGLASSVAYAQATDECETNPSLTCNVPSPEGNLISVEDISNGGRHYTFIAWEVAIEVCIEYGDDLQDAGWTIDKLSTTGDLFSGGCSVTASDSGTGGRAGRYLKLDVAGPLGKPIIDGCIWPTPPLNDPCKL